MLIRFCVQCFHMFSPKKADARVTGCVAEVFINIYQVGACTPLANFDASVFLHMGLIGPEVHALSGPQPHQMGRLAYYPSLCRVVYSNTGKGNAGIDIYTVRKHCRTRVSKCNIAHRTWLQKVFVLNICELFCK